MRKEYFSETNYLYKPVVAGPSTKAEEGIGISIGRGNNERGSCKKSREFKPQHLHIHGFTSSRKPVEVAPGYRFSSSLVVNCRDLFLLMATHSERRKGSLKTENLAPTSTLDSVAVSNPLPKKRKCDLCPDDFSNQGIERSKR